MDYSCRIEELIRRTESFCDGIVISSPISRRYLTGFFSSSGLLFLTQRQSYLLIDSRYIEAACRSVSCCHVLLEESPLQKLSSLVAIHGLQAIGFENHATSVVDAMALAQAVQPAHLVYDSQVSPSLLAMRQIKCREEIQFLREAQEITDYAFSKCLEQIHPGVSEMDLRIFLGETMARQGCEKRHFNMILTSGSRTSLPHGDPAIHILQKRDLVMIDMGAAVGGYSADMTRTIAVGGVSDEQREAYQIVLSAQEQALAAIRPDIRCCCIDQIARDTIMASPYQKGTFGHGLGHSLGLEIHESPRFHPTCMTPLAAGMVMTVEPGIYLSGKFGIRIEDMVVVTKYGCENMTRSPKELLIL